MTCFTLGLLLLARPHLVSATARPLGSQEPSVERREREARSKWKAETEEANQLHNEARRLWNEGHETEALTKMLLAHRDLSALTPLPHGDLFDIMSGYDLARMYEEAGETSEAYGLYRKVLTPDPDVYSDLAKRPDLRLRFSEICAKLGHKREAAEALEQVPGDDPFAKYLTGARHARLHRLYDDAERWFSRAVELSPKDERAKRGLEEVRGVKAQGRRSRL